MGKRAEQAKQKAVQRRNGLEQQTVPSQEGTRITVTMQDIQTLLQRSPAFKTELEKVVLERTLTERDAEVQERDRRIRELEAQLAKREG